MSNLENEALLQEYLDLKRAENDAKAARIECEMKLLEIYGDTVPEDKMSKTVKEGRYSIKISRNVTYKVNELGMEKIMKMPYDERPLKYSFDYTKGRYIPAIQADIIFHETKPTFEVTYK